MLLGLGSIRCAAGTDAFFPLMAWNWAPPDAAAFQKMRECGLTVAHFNYLEVTPADVRYQVFTTLAYGGRGIACFTCYAPQVGKLAPTPLQLTSDAVYHFGAVTFRQPPNRVQMVSPYTGQLTDFAGEQQWLAAGQGTLVKVR